MIEGLDRLLESSGQPGLLELRDVLQEMLGRHEAPGRLIDQQALELRFSRVYRLHFESNGCSRSLVVKCLDPAIARRNQFVMKR